VPAVSGLPAQSDLNAAALIQPFDYMAKLVSARALCNPSPASFFRRDELMRNPHSSVSDKDRPRLLKTLLLGALKTHAPDIYYARYADQDESA
jgi:hypothetical protein